MIRKTAQFFLKNTQQANKFRFCSNVTIEQLEKEDEMVYDAKIKSHSMATDLDILRKQIYFRANNMGMKELDLIVGSWIKRNVNDLNLEELRQFHSEVLEKETPELCKIVLGTDDNPDNEHYVAVLRDYAFNVKDKQFYK